MFAEGEGFTISASLLRANSTLKNSVVLLRLTPTTNSSYVAPGLGISILSGRHSCCGHTIELIGLPKFAVILGGGPSTEIRHRFPSARPTKVLRFISGNNFAGGIFMSHVTQRVAVPCSITHQS